MLSTFRFVPLYLCVAVFSARADSSSPLGQWYLNANSFAISANISSPSPGVYTGTLTNENGGSELLDQINWDAPSRLLIFRRNGQGFWQWYRARIVEGVIAGRFSHSTTSAQKPSQLTSFQYHVTAWNSTYLDTSLTPRVWELLIDQSQRARLRIDRSSSGLVGRLKIYSDVATGASAEQLEYDLEVTGWDGTNLKFTQHLEGSLKTWQGAVSGRTISGSYTPGAGSFTGARAEVIGYGIVPRSPAARAKWIARTRLQLEHLTMAGNPTPLHRSVKVLRSNVPPTPSVTLPPDRDDDPATWPQRYKLTELQFTYTIANPYGGPPMTRTSHGYLAVPTTPPPAGGKYRALLAVNGHNGSAWAMMNPDDGYFWYGDSFARRGYVVLAIDISHRPLEDRANLYNDYPNGDDPAHGNNSHPAIKPSGFDSDWEEDGERGWDARRGLDYLLSLPNVDPKRIVVSGISMGGEVTGITGGLDPRLAMSIPVGYSPDEGVMLYHGNHTCWEWQHGDKREYIDTSDYFALTAPRPLLIEAGRVDPTFSSRNPPFSSDMQAARRNFASYGADAGKFHFYLHYDQHHYHVGGVNPTSPTEQGVRVPDHPVPVQPWSLGWQTDSATHVVQPTLFDAINSLVP
ncbi:MAG: hypothetical protein U0Q18_26285 [Bryobacteraceae bacterium]